MQSGRLGLTSPPRSAAGPLSPAARSAPGRSESAGLSHGLSYGARRPARRRLCHRDWQTRTRRTRRDSESGIQVEGRPPAAFFKLAVTPAMITVTGMMMGRGFSWVAQTHRRRPGLKTSVPSHLAANKARLDSDNRDHRPSLPMRTVHAAARRGRGGLATTTVTGGNTNS